MPQKPDIEQLLQKLFTNSLTVGERKLLNQHPEVAEALQQLWESTPEECTDAEKGMKILAAIQTKIRPVQKQPKHQYHILNKFLLAASVALLMVCGTLSTILMTKSSEPEIWFIASSGHQSMDSIRLADGTLVVLNAGSQLTYPQKFTGKNREVQLSGQAFFNIHKDSLHPFVVRTQSMDVTALGTSFEVFSYKNDKHAETVLLEGKVKVNLHHNLAKGQEFTLNPNDKLSFKEDGQVSIEQIDANTYSAWRLGNGLTFRNERLSMILPRLEKWYGQHIKCPQDIAQHYRFTFTVRDEPLDLVLNIMTSNIPLTYKLVSNNCYLLQDSKQPAGVH